MRSHLIPNSERSLLPLPRINSSVAYITSLPINPKQQLPVPHSVPIPTTGVLSAQWVVYEDPIKHKVKVLSSSKFWVCPDN